TYGKRQYNFSTGSPPPGPDTTPPQLVSENPASYQLALVNTNLVMQFNENVKAGTGNFEIRNRWTFALLESIPVTDTSRVTFSGAQVTINPNADLAPNTTYTLIAASGVILDLAGNSFHGLAQPGVPDQFVFTTVNSTDVTPPSLMGFSPSNNETGVP